MNLHGQKICDNCFSVIRGEPCPKCGYKHNRYRPEIGVLPVGTVLAKHYAIGQVLGKGGFGVTYKAYDMRNDRIVAIKEYYPNGIAHRDTGTTGVSLTDVKQTETFKTGADKFFDEAKTVSKFNGNPNIVSVYEFFYENNTVYYVMEYLEGCDLKQYIKKNGGRLSEGQTLHIFNTLTDALVITHSLNVLHRDISPDNIYIQDSGAIKLIDFGAARQVIAEQSKSLSVILKQGFAPLEQYQRRGKQGPWTDIYALGATMYFALTGKVPEDATERIEDDSIGKASEFGVSEELWKIIEKCLAVRIDDRYQSVYELKADLAKIATVPVPLVTEAVQEIPPTVMAVQQDILPGTVAVGTDMPEKDVLPGTVAVGADTPEKDVLPGTIAVGPSKESDTANESGTAEKVLISDGSDSEEDGKKSPIVAFIRSKKGIFTIAGAVAAIIIIVTVVFVTGNNRKSHGASNNSNNPGNTNQYAEGDTTDKADEPESEQRMTEKSTEKNTEKSTEKKTEEAESEASQNTTEPETETLKETPAVTEAAPAPVPTAAPTAAPTVAPTVAPTATPTVTNQPYTAQIMFDKYSDWWTYTGTYTGEWKNGAPSGNGTFTAVVVGTSHTEYAQIKGTWENGKLNGYGSFAFVYNDSAVDFSTSDWRAYSDVNIRIGTWKAGKSNGNIDFYYWSSWDNAGQVSMEMYEDAEYLDSAGGAAEWNGILKL